MKLGRAWVRLILVATVGCGGGQATPQTPQAPQPATTNGAAAAAAAQGGALPAPDRLVCGSEVASAQLAYSEGFEQFQQQHFAESEAAYLAAIKDDPTFCDAMDNLAVLYRRSDRVDQAIALYERSLKLAPHNEMAWQNLGIAYRTAERSDDALRAYGELVKLAPNNAEGWFGQGQMLVFSEHYREALVSLRRAEALYRAQGSEFLEDAQLFIGLAAAGLEDWALVRTALEPVYDRFSDLRAVNLFLGVAYVQPDAMQPERARTYLERARAQGANVPDSAWQRATGGK